MYFTLSFFSPSFLQVLLVIFVMIVVIVAFVRGIFAPLANTLEGSKKNSRLDGLPSCPVCATLLIPRVATLSSPRASAIGTRTAGCITEDEVCHSLLPLPLLPSVPYRHSGSPLAKSNWSGTVVWESSLKGIPRRSDFLDFYDVDQSKPGSRSWIREN